MKEAYAKQRELRQEIYTKEKEKNMAEQKPSVGRIVHYTSLGDRDGKYPPEVQAALITGVNSDGTVSLLVFYRTGQFYMPSVSSTAAKAGSEVARGLWSWPERV